MGTEQESQTKNGLKKNGKEVKTEMDFLGRLRYAFTNELKTEEKGDLITEIIGVNPTAEELSRFLGGKITVNNSMLTTSTYYSCMQIRCGSIAKLPIKLMKWEKGGSTKAEEHPLYELLRLRPNIYMSTYDFLWATEFQRLHYGNAFWVPEWSVKGIRALHLLDSRLVQIVVDDTGLITGDNAVYYIYTDSRKGMLIYRNEDICHFKNYSLDGIKGTSISKYLYATIWNEQLANTVLGEKYSSGLQDPIVVQYAGDLSDSLSAKIKKKFASLGGAKNAGKVIPIPSEYKVNQLETKLVNSQFFELQGLTTRQIANAFGIKSFQLNDMEKSTYNNVEQQNRAFYSDTLQNVLTSYEQEMNYKLLSEGDRKNHYWKFNVDSVLRSDFASRIDGYSKSITNGIMTIAEAREKEDLPYKEGTDRLILGNGAAVFVDDIGKWKE